MKVHPKISSVFAKSPTYNLSYSKSVPKENTRTAELYVNPCSKHEYRIEKPVGLVNPELQTQEVSCISICNFEVDLETGLSRPRIIFLTLDLTTVDTN